MPQLLSWEEVDLKNVNLFQARHEARFAGTVAIWTCRLP